MSTEGSGSSLAEELMRVLSPRQKGPTVKMMPPEGTVFGENPEQELDFQSKIGEGSFGTVWRAIHRPSGSYVAVKKVSLDGEDEAMKEGSTMKQLCHQNIVRFYAFYMFVPPSFSFSLSLSLLYGCMMMMMMDVMLSRKQKEAWMVMELCAAKSLQAVMKSFKRGLTEAELACTLQQTVKALAYVHAHKRIHRDIKSGNLLLQQDGRIKLCDFGVAGELTSEAKRHTMIGSPYWMAPEVIDDAGHDQKADIWSLGITAIELCETVPPRFSENTMRAIFLISSSDPPTLKEPEKYSDELKDFLKCCLAKNPDERQSSAQLLEHPFIKGAEKCENSHTHSLETKEEQELQDHFPDDKPCVLAELARLCLQRTPSQDHLSSPNGTGGEGAAAEAPSALPADIPQTPAPDLGTFADFGSLSDLTLPSTLKAGSKVCCCFITHS